MTYICSVLYLPEGILFMDYISFRILSQRIALMRIQPTLLFYLIGGLRGFKVLLLVLAVKSHDKHQGWAHRLEGWHS